MASNITERAIHAFDKWARAMQMAERAERELHSLCPRIPDEEMAEYIRRTDAIEQRQSLALRLS